MRLLRLAFLLLVTLAGMRLVSWALGWLLSKLPRLSTRSAAVMANLLCFVAFTAMLYLDLETGEPIDPKAIVFGALVYLVFSTVDVFRAQRVREL